MASSPQKPFSPSELSHSSVQTANDSSVGHPLTRKPGRTNLRDNYAFLAPSFESQQSNNTIKTTPEVPTRPRTYAVNRKTMTMNISLENVNFVQLFFRCDGSIKGIRFDYGNSDSADLGCCMATQPDGGRAFQRPQWLFFTPAPRRCFNRGFSRVERMSFSDTRDRGLEATMFPIRMLGSVTFRLSENPLENGLENRLKSGLEIGITVRRGERTFKRATRAVKGWLGKVRALSGLSTKV